MAIGLLDLLLGGVQDPRARLGGEDTPAGGGILDAVGQRIMAQQMQQQPMQASSMDGAQPVQGNGFAPQQAAGVAAGDMRPQQQGGGLLGQLFGGGRRGPANSTVQWLVNKGFDPSAAQAIASDPQTLRQAVAQYGGPQSNDPKAGLMEVGGAIYDAQAGKWIQNPFAKSETPTDDIREYQEAVKQGYDGSFMDYQLTIKKAGANSTQIKLPGDESEYDKTVGKGYGDRFIDIQKEGIGAQKAIMSLNVMEQAMKQPGFYTGTGSDLVKNAKRLATAVGLNADGVSDMETFNAMAKQAALETMGGSLGTGFSNADRDFVLDQVPTLANSPEGNAKLIAVQKKLAERKLQIAQLAREYARGNNGRIDMGFDDYLAQWAEQNPLFAEASGKGNRYPSAERFGGDSGSSGPKRYKFNPETGTLE